MHVIRRNLLLSLSASVILAVTGAAAAQDPAQAPAQTHPDTSHEADPSAASQYPNGQTTTAAPAATNATDATQQSSDQNNTPQNGDQTIPTFHVNVVGRTTQAINWHHASGTTRVDLRGTQLMPAAHGEARVKSELGRI